MQNLASAWSIRPLLAVILLIEWEDCEGRSYNGTWFDRCPGISGGAMEVPARRPHVLAAGAGLLAGLITIGGCFAALGRFSNITGFQVGWISAAGVTSVVLTIFSTFVAARSAAQIDRVDVTLTQMDVRAKNHLIALLAKVFSMSSSALAMATGGPEQFAAAVDKSLTALQTAIVHCHGLDDSRVRVCLISVSRTGEPQSNGQVSEPEVTTRSVPGDRMPQFDFADQDIYEQFEAVMARRHPYRNGWIWDGFDGHPARGEFHVLSPAEREYTSYIRVGIPGMGVLCVDCSDDVLRLAIADRELTLAFADMIGFHGRSASAQLEQSASHVEERSLEGAR